MEIVDPADAERLMQAALALARRGLGRVWPNPAVGCVLVRDGRVIARGWTQDGGRPHAEAVALSRCRAGTARGAAAVVTLEPCAHHGQSPPCADALIEAGVASVVAAVEDPDPRVDGRGLARLRAAGIAVTTGVCEAEARRLNRGFLHRVTLGRPMFTLKLATSLDGRIALASGASKWITGERARTRGRLLRASHDATLVGVGTALADDPDLTVRLPGLESRAPRVVLDSRLRLSVASRLVASASAHPTWIVTAAAADAPAALRLGERGVVVIPVAADDGGRCDVRAVAEALAQRGLTRVLIEGGGEVAAAFARADLIDEIAWFRAPALLGGDALPAAAALKLDDIAAAPRYIRTGWFDLGPDSLETFERAAP